MALPFTLDRHTTRRLTCTLLASGCIFLASACKPNDDGHLPTSAEIESAEMLAQNAGNTDAERQLRRWADRGIPIAQRELGLLYLTKAGKRGDALGLFESAGLAGDGEAAYQRGESLLRPLAGEARDPARAWRWYRLAAEHDHAVAALNLARMAHDGDGVPVDAKLAGQWLTFASDHGNAQAMFLLSNAYMTGDGVPRNPLMARRLLEMSADKDYPVAIQALAQAVQGGDLLIPKDDLRADHLLKEATEERPNRWAAYR